MGIGLVIVGAACLLLSFTSFDWYTGLGNKDSIGSARFSDLHHFAGLLGENGLTTGYFSWTAWVLLILMSLLGSFAGVPRRDTEVLRVFGLLAGLLGAALTYYALNQISYPGHVSSGVWLAYIGFLAGGTGAAVGSWPFTVSPRPATVRPESQGQDEPGDEVAEPRPQALQRVEAEPPRPSPQPVATAPARPRPRPGPRPGPSPTPHPPITSHPSPPTPEPAAEPQPTPPESEPEPVSTVTKAPAKKAPAKKLPAKKVPARKVPAKKVAAQKTPAKKAPAKKTPPPTPETS